MTPSLSSYRPPLAAILRGLPAADADAIADALFDVGFRLIEVPLNRPGALEAIERVARRAPAQALVGGGTVLTPADVSAVAGAGGRWVVSPHCDPSVIDRAVAMGLLCVPGVGTATEAFTALRHGAHGLKLFPAEVWGPRGLKALKAVLPPDVPLWPVGGVSPETLGDWHRAGAGGFGIGGQLYQPGDTSAAVRQQARRFLQAWDAVSAPAAA